MKRKMGSGILAGAVIPWLAAGSLSGQAPAQEGAVPVQVEAGAEEVPASPVEIQGVVVTARRVEEVAQEVPIPLAVVSGEMVESAGAFNVNRLQTAVPTIQFYTTNPRNSFLNIRGLGLPFGLANDGIEPGVG